MTRRLHKSENLRMGQQKKTPKQTNKQTNKFVQYLLVTEESGGRNSSYTCIAGKKLAQEDISRKKDKTGEMDQETSHSCPSSPRICPSPTHPAQLDLADTSCTTLALHKSYFKMHPWESKTVVQHVLMSSCNVRASSIYNTHSVMYRLSRVQVLQGQRNSKEQNISSWRRKKTALTTNSKRKIHFEI